MLVWQLDSSYIHHFGTSAAANVRVTFYLDDLPDANQIRLHFMIILFKRPANKYCDEQCCSKTWPFLIFSRTKWYRSSIWVGALVTFWLLSQRDHYLKILRVFASNHLAFPFNTWRISHTLLFFDLAFLLAATLDTANVVHRSAACMNSVEKRCYVSDLSPKMQYNTNTRTYTWSTCLASEYPWSCIWVNVCLVHSSR